MRMVFFPVLFIAMGCALPPRPERPALSRHVDAVLGPRANPVEGGVALGSVGNRLRAEKLDLRPGFSGRFHYLHQPGIQGSLFRLELREGGRPVIFPRLTHQWWPSHVGMEGKADGLHLVERKFITQEDRAIDLVSLRNESKEVRDILFRISSDLPMTKGMRGKLGRAEKHYPYSLSAGSFVAGVVTRPVHGAYNPERSSDVQPRASFTGSSDSMWAPIDGDRSAARRWTCWSSGNESDWYEVEFPDERMIRKVVVHLVDDQAGISPPSDIRLQYEQGRVLADVPGVTRSSGDGRIIFTFDPVRTGLLRLVFTHEKGRYSGMTELEIFPGEERKIPVLERRIRIGPGQMVSFPVEFVFDGDADPAPSPEILQNYLKRYNDWFGKQIPDFECPDPWFVKLWYHRWFLLRKSLSFPDTSLISGSVFLIREPTGEGRSLDPAALPFQIREARWLRDSRFAIDHLRAAWGNQYEVTKAQYEGQLPVLQAHRKLNLERPNWAGRAPWELHLVHPNQALLEELSPRIERQVQGLRKRLSGELDRACYLFSVLDALEKSGFPQDDLARQIRDMVGADSGNQSKGMDKITALFPYAFGVVPVGNHRHDDVFSALFDPAKFWAPFPARITSKYREKGTNGETRVWINVLVLDALARAIRQYEVPTVTRRRFFDFLQRMVHAQFEDGDFRRPRVGDRLDSETGEWKTPDHGVFATPYADLLIRFVGGLVPRGDETLEFHPLVNHFSSFRFQRVPYHGALLDIIWDAPDGVDRYGDQVEGFTVRRNGKTLFTKQSLQHVVWTN